MKKLVLGVLLGLIAACGGGSDGKKGGIIDTPTVDSPGVLACNPLTQTGCNPGEKCTWIYDATTPDDLGHMGCVADGTVALGGACMFSGAMGVGNDNCQKGLFCISGKCATICEPGGGAPMCPTNFACSNYDGVSANGDDPPVFGVCDATCNAFADNDFDGSAGPKMKTGTACAANQGCYGYPSGFGTKFTCTGEINPALVHRSACTTMAQGAGAPQPCRTSGGVYINGCKGGYEPLLREDTGSMQTDCIALCKPVNTYMGNATNAAAGTPGDACNDIDRLSAGTGFASTTNAVNGANGDHCTFSWIFEYDQMGMWHQSPTSDTVGVCINHAKIRYDSNGDGMVTMADSTWKHCPSIPMLSTGSGSAFMPGADFFGCLNSTLAQPLAGKRPDVLIEKPRFPYHNLKAQLRE